MAKKITSTNPHKYAEENLGFSSIEVLENNMTPDQFEGYLRGNIENYLMRYRKKGGSADLRKARWYLDDLIAHLEK